VTSDGASVVGGKRAVLEAIRAGVASEVLVSASARRNDAIRDVLSSAARGGVPVTEVDRAELDAVAADHRGIAARVSAEPSAAVLTERDLETRVWAEDAIAVVLDGVEDPQNLGASARCAEAAGAAVLVTRTHRAAPVSPAAIRASAGALLHVPTARVANISRAIDRLRDAGFTAVGLDGDAERSIYDEPCPDGRVALVVGAEGSGLSRLVRERCDLLVSLPMRGRVGSLNASASLAAALYAYVLPARAGAATSPG
jgi:23S rRNA (guanosine2251-2'-O)-methyltransferase